jgi:hypothetical protein
MPESGPNALPTYGFYPDGRTVGEVNIMKKTGYGEDPEFADPSGAPRTDGYLSPYRFRCRRIRLPMMDTA